jgi:predicted DNA-binding transcriptional regulator YafY
MVAANEPHDSESMARVKVRHDHALGLRRQTVDISHEDGWDIITVPCPDPHRLAEQVIAYGADAVILSPAEARNAVVQRLRALAEATA